MTVKAARKRDEIIEKFLAVEHCIAVLRSSRDTEAQEMKALAEMEIKRGWENFNLEKEAAEEKLRENTRKERIDLAGLQRLRTEEERMLSEREELQTMHTKLDAAEKALKEQDMIMEINQAACAQVLNEKNAVVRQVEGLTVNENRLKETLADLESKLESMAVGSSEDDALNSKIREAIEFRKEWDARMSRPAKSLGANGAIITTAWPDLASRKWEILEVLRKNSPQNPITEAYLSKAGAPFQYLPFDYRKKVADDDELVYTVSNLAALNKAVSFERASPVVRRRVLPERQDALREIQFFKFYQDHNAADRLRLLQKLVDFYDTRFQYQICKLVYKQYDNSDPRLILGGNKDTLDFPQLNVGSYNEEDVIKQNRRRWRAFY
ncbi:hypothetical protein BKA65DRAFT_474433 [Rhexocercosporidium sp. MPI-PUGE-AT-0058]|nr:hypothetical protein BKA65DRAFT_474433 [Rhexocercosporidium sp. MPI-PUGE-AT-0058]